jgi:hypothetical protein
MAETLIELKNASKHNSDILLRDGYVLVYIQKGCAPCHEYVQDLARCQEPVKSKVRIVSVSTLSQSKVLARKIPDAFPFYVMKDQRIARSYGTTPITKSARGIKIGKLTCEILEELD